MHTTTTTTRPGGGDLACAAEVIAASQAEEARADRRFAAWQARQVDAIDWDALDAATNSATLWTPAPSDRIALAQARIAANSPDFAAVQADLERELEAEVDALCRLALDDTEAISRQG